MAYPEIPALSYSYTAFQQSQGDFSFPGTPLDNDLALIRNSVASIVAFLQLFARSDGKLGSGTVTKESLDASLLLGVGSPTIWTPGVAYKDGDTVVVTGANKLYVAKTAHTAGSVFNSDLSAARWLLLADFNAFTIADGSITTPKLANLAATAAKLADAAVETAKIAALAVTEPKMADGAGSTRVLADGAATTAKIGDGAVTTVKQADGSTTTSKLADGAVTKAKMANVGGQRLVGNADSLSGVPTDLEITQVLDWLSSTRGAVLYRGASGWAALAPGGVGAVLTSGGPGADPSFSGTTLSQFYQSTEQTIAVASPITLTHGLGAAPKMTVLELICKTAEAGYAIDDRVQLPNSALVNASSATHYEWGVATSASSIFIRTPQDALAVPNKASGVATSITPANWRLIVRAFR